MKEIKMNTKLKAVKLFLNGDTFDEIAQQLGIAKGSVVNIIDDFRNGLLPLPFGMAEYVDELRHLVVDLKKHQTTIAAVKPCFKIHARMKEMGVGDEQVEQWLDISENIASTTVTNGQFVKSALELAEVTAANGMSYQSVVEDYNCKRESNKKLSIDIQHKEKQNAQATAELDTITKAAVTAQDNFTKQKEGLESQMEEHIKQHNLSWEKVNTVAAIINTELGQIGLDQKGISEISKQVAETGSLTIINKQLDEKKNDLQSEIDDLKKEEVHFKGSVKSLSDINGKIVNSLLVKGPQRDELNAIIKEQMANLKDLNQSILQGTTILFEANLIAAFLILPNGLDNDKLDKFVRLMVALRQKRLGVALEQGKDAAGNLTCQCTIPVIGNLDDKDIDMDIIRNQLALNLMPLVKDKFIPLLQHDMELALCKAERPLFGGQV